MLVRTVRIRHGLRSESMRHEQVLEKWGPRPAMLDACSVQAIEDGCESRLSFKKKWKRALKVGNQRDTRPESSKQPTCTGRSSTRYQASTGGLERTEL